MLDFDTADEEVVPTEDDMVGYIMYNNAQYNVYDINNYNKIEMPVFEDDEQVGVEYVTFEKFVDGLAPVSNFGFVKLAD